MDSFVPTICSACEGDAHASLTCSVCHGAGVTVPSPDGILGWRTIVDDGLFRIRRVNHILDLIIHGLLIVAILGAFTLFFLETFSQSMDVTQIFSFNFWVGNPHPMFWVGILLTCVLVYRLRVRSQKVQALPNWGLSKRQLATQEKRAQRHVKNLDIAKYFDEEAWLVIERAYTFAMQIGKSEVLPIHIFLGTLSGGAGGIFLTRLGTEYSQVKDGIMQLVREQGKVGTPSFLSNQTKQILLQAYVDARTSGRKYVGSIELLLQSFLADQKLQDVFDRAGFPVDQAKHVAAWIRIQEQLREQHDRFIRLAALKPQGTMDRLMTARQTLLLNQFSEDLTLLARNGYLSPILNREREMNELFRLIESGRQGIVLVGETGVGKMALIEGLARQMVEEDVPPELFDRRLVSVHIAQLIASGDSSSAMDRLLTLLHEVAISGNIVLVLQGIEALVGGGNGPLDLAEALATEIDKARCLVIATITPEAWTTHVERRTLGTKLARLLVTEPSPDQAIGMLMARTGYLEYQNGVFFSYAALDKAANLAGRYLREVSLPESALTILQEAAVLVRKERGDGVFVTAEDVARIIHEKTNIPVEAVQNDESQKLLHLEEFLHKRVVGQVDAVNAVAQAMRRARAELRDGKRPIANFLFLGPTGVGKTELAKALAAEYFGSESSMIRLDMSEYQDSSAAARVIGLPGDTRGGLLTEAIRKNPFSIVLLDELEKAHPDILTLFLQVMDDGRLTDGVGRTVDCTNIVLIATSNAGTGYIQEAVSQGQTIEQIKTALLERELKSIFRPEFLNRFDGVIVFKPLSLDEVTQIAWLLINGIGQRLEAKGMTFHAEDEAVEALAKAGYDPLFGARPLRRVIQERVDNGLANLLLQKQVRRGEQIILQADGSLRVEDSPSHAL